MKDSILFPFSAVFFGAVLGIAACLPIQAVQNVSAARRCEQKTSHQLVSVRNFWGDSLHCVHRDFFYQ